jgi:hypothetical protein
MSVNRRHLGFEKELVVVEQGGRMIFLKVFRELEQGSKGDIGLRAESDDGQVLPFGPAKPPWRQQAKRTSLKYTQLTFGL